MIGLCDCNNFFVSCERVFNPSLEGKPVIVLSSNDGCVIARSNESKALGIKMGQPLFQIRKTVDDNKIIIHSSNYQLYGDMSHRVMQTLKGEVASIEVYSIDEAFLDLSGIDTSQLKSRGEALSRKIRRNTGIPVSIGIAPTKTLAKIASKLCKSHPKFNGACLLYRPEDVKKVLSTYPISDVWGIGRRSTAMLKMYGITTAEQFVLTSEEWVSAKMGLTGLRTWRELRGEPSILFDERPTDRRSIMVSRSFSREISQIDELRSALAEFLSSAAEKLRQQNSVAAQMQVFILTNRFHTAEPQQTEGQIIRFDTPTNSTLELMQGVTRALKLLYRPGYSYKKAGVILYDISSDSGVQGALFDDIERDKHSSLMQTLDSINSRWGKHSIHLGAVTNDKPRVSSEHLSPKYTTSWQDILKIKV